MKTRYLFMAAAALAAALSLGSCNKKELVPTTEGRELTMTLTLPGGTGTRAVFEENLTDDGTFAGLKTKWELGDEISVGVMDNYVASTFTAVSVSEDGQTAEFSGKAIAEWGDLSDGIGFWSVYPKEKDSGPYDWRQQDGTLASLPDYDLLWVYSYYTNGKLIPADGDFTRDIYLFRFPEGFAFCDADYTGDITLEISGDSIFSMYEINTEDYTPATGENTIQVGPVSVSSGVLTDDIYVAAATSWYDDCYEINICVSPEDDSWVRKYKLSYSDGFNNGQLYTITSVSKLQLLAEAVDLGLPSGLKWATWNLGATSPEEYGDYFAWGETSGYNGGKTDFSWATYKWMQSGQSDWKHITKYTFADEQKGGIWYDGDTFKGDNGDGVEHKDFASYDYVDDAARANWGGSWRTPTDAEWTALRDEANFDWSWTDDYEGTGIAGRIVTSKVPGYEGNSIFLPAAGFRYGTSLINAGSYGYYWSSSLSEHGSDYARYVNFNSGEVGWYYDIRYDGFSVRPVSE